MDLLWPGFLILLLLVPLLIGVYIWIQRRRRPAIRYSSLSLVREAMPKTSRWRRHLPFGLFVAALSSLVIAAGRPVAIVTVPSGQATIILSMDVSRSMCSTDIPPNRLIAAQDAALSFIQRQSTNTQIGIVAFAGFAELIQPPTSDQELLEDAINSLIPARRTAIGSGILKALDAIAELDPNVAPSVTKPTDPVPTPVPNGAFAPHIIVLLTDGASNAGPSPLAAAQQAADRGIRVYTIGYGTASGGPMMCGGQFFGGGGNFGGGSSGFSPESGGGGFRRGIDEETLKQVAEITDGEYYSAESAADLQKIFENLPTYLIAKHETMEISVAFAAIGAALVAAAMLLAILWHPLP